MGFQFKAKLALVGAIVNGLVAALTYLITADPKYTIIAMVIIIGLTQGLSYYKQEANGHV